ncbi:MAG TPA: hypothetical protein VE954_07785, partial [Oligoflexus sp.]|uniref:hypothetical protein n=1 Tax=Oligoflexus sp. TaxID=1971216 RepID=UPI002D661A14
MEFFNDDEETCSSKTKQIKTGEAPGSSSPDSDPIIGESRLPASQDILSPLIRACLQQIVNDFKSRSSFSWLTRSLEEIKAEEARLTKYYDRLNPDLPLEFGMYLIEIFEDIEELESGGDPELARVVENRCQGVMKEADRLIAMEKSEESDVDSFLAKFEALRDKLDEEIAAAKAEDVATDHQGTQNGYRHELYAKSDSSLTENDLERIRLHLYSTIGSWHPDAEEAGGGKYHILSPFRADRTKGSFVIFPDGRARDFATGERYDVIDIWAQLNGLSLSDAFRTHAERLGIAGTSRRVSTPSQKTSPNVPPERFPEPHEAFFVHAKHGKPSQVYCYKNLQGQTIGFVARYDTPDRERKKDFCPVSFTHDAQG